MSHTEVAESITVQSNIWDISDVIALLALIIAILSIIISVIALRVQRNLNTTNLQATYYEEIFKKYLMKEIPESAKNLFYDENGKLCREYRELNNVLIKMLDDASYFAYADNVFYDELREKCGHLDERLVREGGVVIQDKDKQKENIYMLNVEIMDLVKYINKRYSYCK